MDFEEEMVKQGRRIEKVESLLEGLRTENKEQDAAIQAIRTDIAEMLAMFRSFQGAFQVLGYVAKFARPLTAIVAFLTAVVVFIKTGGRS